MAGVKNILMGSQMLTPLVEDDTIMDLCFLSHFDSLKTLTIFPNASSLLPWKLSSPEEEVELRAFEDSDFSDDDGEKSFYSFFGDHIRNKMERHIQELINFMGEDWKPP